MDSPTPTPQSRAARVAARARWGPPRVVRLDELEPPYRRLVLTLVEAAREESAREAVPDAS